MGDIFRNWLREPFIKLRRREGLKLKCQLKWIWVKTTASNYERAKRFILMAVMDFFFSPCINITTPAFNARLVAPWCLFQKTGWNARLLASNIMKHDAQNVWAPSFVVSALIFIWCPSFGFWYMLSKWHPKKKLQLWSEGSWFDIIHVHHKQNICL